MSETMNRRRPVMIPASCAQAVIEGRKTVARLPMDPQPKNGYEYSAEATAQRHRTGVARGGEFCFDPPKMEGLRVWFQGPHDAVLHGPLHAAALLLTVTTVRPERLQDITDKDALAEGIELRGMTRFDGEARAEFARRWDSIYGAKPGQSWPDNPWVWRVTFRVPGSDA